MIPVALCAGSKQDYRMTLSPHVFVPRAGTKRQRHPFTIQREPISSVSQPRAQARYAVAKGPAAYQEKLAGKNTFDGVPANSVEVTCCMK